MKATDVVQRTGELYGDNKESTELSLFVRTSDEELKKWDRAKIFDALMRETTISEDAAAIVSREVEKMMTELEIDVITAPLIRELTNAKLVEYGLSKIRKQHTRLGVPLYDARQIIMMPNKENANVPHNPEATNLTLAENIKKEFALLEVFSQDLADAHMRGDIHLHDLGMVDRPYCSGQSIEYVKKFGLNLPNALSIAKPARHPEVLIEQIIKFSAALQGHFSGAIGWDAFNLFLAPYLENVDDKRMKQLAQILIYEFAQQAVARGGQSIFSDLNLYWECPKHFLDVEAIGPEGKFTGQTYKDYLPEAQRFLSSLMDVYLEGDAMGRPFFFPKPNVHMTDRFFQSEGHEEFLLKLAKVSSEKGNTYYVFDRGDTAKISECCRLTFKLDQSDLDDAKTPWKMRYSAMQNVTLNLPRVAYEAHQDDRRLFDLLTQRIEMVAQAHIQKREFITQLFSMGKSGPLSLLTMDIDGEPYYRIHKSSFLVGMVGLNEMVQYHTGEQLHESTAAMKFGLKVISYMKNEAERIGAEYGLKMPLEQTPAESTAYRFAKLDMKYFPLQSPTVIRGNKSNGEIYYTNSTYLNVGAQISAIERVKSEGRFHPLIDAGSLTHVWLGESKPPAESIAAFVKKTFEGTQNAQIAFSPEFTSCLSCGQTVRGLKESCPKCGSPDIEGITRVTGFFSKTRGWNKGKMGELKDRVRNNIG
ncbi:anaerobic ribonucleoside-triphosphate reductase [Methanomassiliicoccus luminyensis]|uniref:anaerobic ribonucleoside-triphosphate reductase n=1 Tax=Methanomassiliicoccus luminyensis TaxID=1080712 RepID=UPI00037BF8C2|nr:anaerobic ribonucleoside-triphosphate reductase [Methanomassiliicoccus luminyensis]